MITKYVLPSTVVTIALTLPMFGQATNEDTTRSGMKQHDMSALMGTPTVDATVKGLHMKVWIMTQETHKKMMKEKMDQMMKHGGEEGAMGQMAMKDSTMGVSKATRDSMMAGTHHIMLVISDTASGKEIGNASANVLSVSPSEKQSSVALRPMMSHYGGPLTLDEKGNYQFTVIVAVGAASTTKQFVYTVK